MSGFGEMVIVVGVLGRWYFLSRIAQTLRTIELALRRDRDEATASQEQYFAAMDALTGGRPHGD
jgi:hypothetical protein